MISRGGQALQRRASPHRQKQTLTAKTQRAQMCSLNSSAGIRKSKAKRACPCFYLSPLPFNATAFQSRFAGCLSEQRNHFPRHRAQAFSLRPVLRTHFKLEGLQGNLDRINPPQGRRASPPDRRRASKTIISRPLAEARSYFLSPPPSVACATAGPCGAPERASVPACSNQRRPAP